jgi:hypothetical protein
MHFRVRQILKVRFSAFTTEEDVVLPPKDDRFGLTFTQGLLPLAIERHVGLVIVEKVQLHAL